MPIQTLNLNDGERVIVHRGLSSPICPNAEQSRIIAQQTRDGHEKITAALFLPLIKGEEIDLRFLEIRQLTYKNIGEPNALPFEKDSIFYGWWFHISQIGGQHFGIIGRPNRRMKLGPKYEIPFPNLISTKKWRIALDRLDHIAPEYIQDLREIQYPYLAAAFDTSRSPLDSNWRMTL